MHNQCGNDVRKYGCEELREEVQGSLHEQCFRYGGTFMGDA